MRRRVGDPVVIEGYGGGGPRGGGPRDGAASEAGAVGRKSGRRSREAARRSLGF